MKSSMPSTSRIHSQLADLRLRQSENREKPQQFRKSSDTDADAQQETFLTETPQIDVLFEQAFARIDDSDATLRAAWAAAGPQTPASAAPKGSAKKAERMPIQEDFEAIWSQNSTPRQPASVDATHTGVEHGLYNGRLSPPSSRMLPRDKTVLYTDNGITDDELAQREASPNPFGSSRANARLMMLSSHLAGRAKPSTALGHVRHILTEQRVTSEEHETPQSIYKTILLGLGTAHNKFRTRIEQLMSDYYRAAFGSYASFDDDRPLRIDFLAIFEACQTLEKEERHCFQASVESFKGEIPEPDRERADETESRETNVHRRTSHTFIVSDLGFMSRESRAEHLVRQEQYYATIYKAIGHFANGHQDGVVREEDLRQADGRKVLNLLGELMNESKHKSIYVGYDLNLRHQTHFEWAQTRQWTPC